MFVICDSANVVQDITTEEANLSRGLGFPGYKLYRNVKLPNVRIGDLFDGIALTLNAANRAAKEKQLQDEALITAKIRELAIKALKDEGKL